MSRYLHVFVLNEIKLRSSSELMQYQLRLAKLFGYVLQHGLPMEQLRLGSFKETLFQARNSEEALLVVLNACATITKQVSVIQQPDPTAFGAWFKRIQGQRTGPESVLSASCLSFLDLTGSFLDIGDFYGANFHAAKLTNVKANFAVFERADLTKADMTGGEFTCANFSGADLRDANLEKGAFHQANLTNAQLVGANLREGHFYGADFEEAHLAGADFTRAKLRSANMRDANLRGARLDDADMENVDMKDAMLEGTILDAPFAKQKPAKS